MLTLERIDVTLGKGTKLERKILKNLSITIQDGDFVVIIGGNGAGKSTLFNVISGSLTPDNGRVMVDGKNLTNSPQSARAQFFSKVMQDPIMGTMGNMTIFENMAFALKKGERRGFASFFNRGRKKIFQEKLKLLRMGLEDRLDQLVDNLSGGQRQAMSLIMAILTSAKTLLLDEITAALDPQTAELIMYLTAQIVQEEKRTCIMITHNMAHAIKYGNRLLVLKEGTFIQEYDYLEKAKLTPLMLAASFGEI